MKKVLKQKKYLLLFILLAAVTVTTVSKLSKSKLFTSLRKDTFDYTEVQDGDGAIDGSTDVTFDVYFLKDKNNDGEAEGYRGSRIEYGKQDKLYFDLNVSGNAILKNGTITFVNKNVKVGGVLAKSSVIPSTLSNTNYRSIRLSEVSPGTSSFFYLNVSPYIENDLNSFSGTNKIIFRGTVVNNITGEETPVEKVIEYDVDTYATKISTSINETKTSGSLNNTSSSDVNYVNITYTIQAIENYDAMPMKASYISGSVSNFAGYHPTEVRVASADGTPIEFEYNSENQTFSAVKKAIVNEDNIITRHAYTARNGSIRYNKWYVYVTYETEKNDVLDNKNASINVKVYNTGFANENLDEVKSNEVNRVLSHIMTSRPPIIDIDKDFLDKSKIVIGSYANSIQNYFVDKTFLDNVYLGLQTGNFTFKEYWNLNTRTDRETELFYHENGTRLSNTSIVSYLNYKTLKVNNKPNVSNYKISIYNGETNELLHVITKDNVNDTFEFPADVKLINIKTNKLSQLQTFHMGLEVEKEIDSTQLMNSIPLQTFATFGTISNSGRVYQLELPTSSNPYNGNSSFSETYSNASLKTNKTSYAREISETSIPMTYTIKHNTVDVASKTWKEGYYLLKLPQSVIDVENLRVTPASMVVSSEVVDIDGTKFIKIISNNPNTSNSDINVSFNAVVNPKSTDCSGFVELYAINNTNTLYNSSRYDTYDADGDGITTEKTAYSSIYISITAPNELLTGAIIKDYDTEGSRTISPLIADIDPTKGDSDAIVDVFLINNSSFKMKNVTVVGKLAYLNNTYEGIEGALGSQYDVELAGPIQVPSSLDGKVTIYYSTVESPTRDLTNTSNGWTREVTDYSIIKSYMIVVDDSIEFKIGDTYDFEFPINVPNTTANLLKVTYFNHGVYFNRITDEGTRAGHVTAPKLGIRMARKYDLDLDAYRAFSSNKAPGGQYILTDNDGKQQTISLDNNGHALVKGLYVGKEYTLKQHSAPYRYVVDSTERTFKVTNKNDDSLELTYDGEYRRIEYNDNNQLDIDLNMEILYTLDLHNIDSESNADIKNTIFKITGKNHENGINITTDSEGHAYLSDMELGETYKVEQIKIDGYAKVDAFNIKIERDPNTHEIKILKEEYPEITKATCHQIFDTVRDDYVASNASYSTSGGNYKCNLEIDLTKFRDNYKLSGQAVLQDYIDSSNNPSASFSLVKNEENQVATPFLTMTKGTSTGWQRYYENFNVLKAYEKDGSTYKETNFKGGSKYYLLVNYNHGRYSTSNPTYSSATRVIVQSLKVRSTDSNDIEFIFQDETENVNPKDNTNVYQTIKNYSVEETNNPILEVEVKNKYITKATLEITKKDGETGEILSGAQYKITGPGLPAKGKYVTIDENGKGSVDLYLSYTGDTYYIPGLNNNYPTSNTYTIEEIIPPTGYSLDNKPVDFLLVADADYDSETHEITYKYKLNYDTYSGNNNKFPSYEIDAENKIWKVTMEDFPIVKVSKTDEETGEILPNTYYAVYKVNRANGIETTEFATDADGNYIGEKLIIDDKEYYVVKTDEKGEFTLNLPSGQYQLKEIQAADDKYEISDQITYFGVGETIPYQAAGLTLKRGISLNNVPLSERTAKVYNTSDGGYVYIVLGSNESSYGLFYMIKYDSNFNMKWLRSYTSQYKYDYYYYYFDDPDRVYKETGYQYQDNYTNYYTFKELDDGFYVGLGYDDLYLIDKNTGNVIKRSSEINPGLYTYTYQERCTVPEGQTTETYSEQIKVPGSDTEYYCSIGPSLALNYWSYYDYNSHIAFDDEGYAYVISKVRANGEYGFKLKDGTVVVPEKKPLQNGSYTSYGDTYYMLKMDVEGNIYEAIELTSKLQGAITNLVETKFGDDVDTVIEKYLRYHYSNFSSYTPGDYTIASNPDFSYYKNNFKVLPNGEIAFSFYSDVFKMNFKYTSTNSSTGQTNIYDNNTTWGSNFVIFLDSSDYSVKRIIPLGFNGNSLSINNNSNYIDNELYFNDDGSFEYHYPSSFTMGYDNVNTNDYYALSNKLYYGDSNTFDMKEEEGHPTGYSTYVVFKWDKNGKADKFVELARNIRYPELYDTTNDMKRVYHYYESYMSLIKVDGGYIVGSPLTSRGYNYHNSEPYLTVELKSGEIVRLDEKTTYILYKVNEEDDSIEWVKQYGNLFSDRYSVNRIDLVNNKFLIYKQTIPYEAAASKYGNVNGELVSSINDPGHAVITGTVPYVLLEFELLDEVAPEAPSSTTLKLTNKRKEHKINVDSNDGGKIIIIDEENDVIHEGDAPGLVEKVKHGDDSLKTIKVVPNSGFEIKKITVNGEDADITVNSDGSVTIDKFTNVKEEKNISVTFERGMSRVTVHHYLKDTTTKISQDELLTGRIDTSYTTEAKVNELYDLAKDEEGEYILPRNANGTFEIEPIEVTYYYEPKFVKVKTNFYLKDSNVSLADSVVSTVILGSDYNTTPADIPHYTVVDVLGITSGVALDELTEVTYYYENSATGTVIIKYVDEETEEEITEQKTKVIQLGGSYTTTKLNITPRGYKYSHSTNNTTGSIMEPDEEITVVYYYKAIKPVVTTRYIDYKTNKDIADKVIDTYKFDDEYTTHQLEEIPNGYKLKEIPSNYKGIADSENIEVKYYYVKKDVKDEVEDNPETNDNITKYLALILVSSIGLITTYKLKKKFN